MSNTKKTAECEWCNRKTGECGKLYEHTNLHYQGWFCEACVWLSDLASEAVENDES